MTKRRGSILILGLVFLCLVVMKVLVSGSNTEDKQGEEAYRGMTLTRVEAIDQTASMPHPAFIKAPYVPVVIEGDNIALSAKAEANGFNQSYAPAKAIDGNVDGPSYWEGEQNAYPNILTLDFGREAEVHGIKIRVNPAAIWGPRTQTMTITYRDMAGEEVVLFEEAPYGFDPETGNEVVLTFDALSMEALLVSITDNTGAVAGQIAEIEVYE